MEKEKSNNMKKALSMGILASAVFSFTFILNKTMSTSGGSWYWSAILRYVFMLPILALVLGKKKTTEAVREVQNNRKEWYLWSIVGFGLFYTPLALASEFGESWLVAGTWQITMITGALMAPLFGGKIPLKNVFVCLFVLVGVFLMQYDSAVSISIKNSIYCVLSITVAAICYPLGNRKTMILAGNRITTTQRVFNMTLCSMPFWILLSIYALFKVGLPSGNQIFQSILVAIFPGVIATLLYFGATDLVKDNQRNLAVIEATIAGEVIFTLIGGVLIAHDALPSIVGFVGLIIVTVGMVLNSLVGRETKN